MQHFLKPLLPSCWLTSHWTKQAGAYLNNKGREEKLGYFLSLFLCFLQLVYNNNIYERTLQVVRGSTKDSDDEDDDLDNGQKKEECYMKCPE